MAMLRDGASWSGRERNCCFVNLAGSRFVDASGLSGLDFLDDGRGMALTDWDNDGAVDLWFSNRTGPRVRFMHNRLSSGNHFLAVHLTGQTCNRDAIGARVELFRDNEPERRQIATLRAGGGYLSQSSKWLHFGLGQSDSPADVTVHWPDGSTEEFRGLRCDAHYRLVQGSGMAEPWSRPPGIGSFTPSNLIVPPSSDRARIVLAALPPMPKLEYTDFNGVVKEVPVAKGHPVLVNLWASWCPNCLAELGELATHGDELRGAGLRILALSVDEGPEREDAKRLLQKLDWRFEAGFTTPSSVDVLDILQRAALDRKRPLPLPTSFLIDGQNRLAYIYKGPFRTQRLLEDVKALSDGRVERRAQATPFPGRWLALPKPVNLLALGLAFSERGYGDIARWYFSQIGLPEYPDDIGRAGEVDRESVTSLLGLAATLMNEGMNDEAIAAYQRVLRLDPDAWEAHVAVGLSLLEHGRNREAAYHFRQWLKLHPPDAVSALVNLGTALARDRRVVEGVNAYREALEHDSDSWRAHYNLGLLFAGAKRHAKAVEHLAEFVRLQPDNPEAHRYLGKSLTATGRAVEGIFHYEQSLSLAPDDVRAREGLGKALMRVGRLDEAAEQFRRVLQADPRSTDARCNLATVLLASGEVDHAIEAYKQVLRDAPQHWTARFNLGLSYLKTGNVDAAKKEYEALRPTRPQLAATLLAGIRKHEPS